MFFSSHGYDLLIDNELVAEAFASLPEQEQSILILHCVLELADGEIGGLMGMSRRRRPAPQDKHPETVAREIDGVNAGREVTRMKQPTFNGKELLPPFGDGSRPCWGRSGYGTSAGVL